MIIVIQKDDEYHLSCQDELSEVETAVRVSQEEKDKTHRRIVEGASRLIRERGIVATSVADVMGDAGMTHGGFYRHFADKDALVVAALESAFGERLGELAAGFKDQSPQAAVAAYRSHYLQDGHVAAAAMGCPIPTIASDVARASSALKATFGIKVCELVALLARGMDGTAKERERSAFREIAMLAGAIMIARASDAETARDMLKACRTT